MRTEANDTGAHNDIAVVVIGRNEGARLRRCLESVRAQVDVVVYVDSGSTDGSVELARSFDADVVELDSRAPFSAGRARNRGFARLRERHGPFRYVQFIDGDCELAAGWIARARRYLCENASYAVVAGRVTERNPRYSIYNQLCDIEWNRPPGEARSCGGIFMTRATAFMEVGGFNPEMVGGEEPELCYRLRRLGWRIYVLSAPMAVHDAGIVRFGQWWKRTVRGGFAWAHEHALHRSDREGYRRRELMRIWFWAVVLPCGTLAALGVVGASALLVLLAYPVQVARISVDYRRRTSQSYRSVVYAFFEVLAKWPQLAGQLMFVYRRIAGARPEIIEYK